MRAAIRLAAIAAFAMALGFAPGVALAQNTDEPHAQCAQGAGEEFDITAEPGGRALTFGAGPHFCLGSNLARAELEEAIVFLAPRMRDLRPAAPAELGGVEGIYGIESLPLAWSQV